MSLNKYLLEQNEVLYIDLFDRTCVDMSQKDYKIGNITHPNCDQVQLYFAPYLYRKYITLNKYVSIYKDESNQAEISDFTIDICFKCIGIKYYIKK